MKKSEITKSQVTGFLELPVVADTPPREKHEVVLSWYATREGK